MKKLTIFSSLALLGAVSLASVPSQPAIATFTLTQSFNLAHDSYSVIAQDIPKRPLIISTEPLATCIESSWNGKVVCGYNCVESSWNGKVACADWPGGACKVSSWNGQITCGPSAPKRSFIKSTKTVATCIESSWNGKIVCGYNCVESSWDGKVACADWPGGACKVSSWNGQITCGPSVKDTNISKPD